MTAKLLVIDDDVSLCKLLELTLTRNGYQVDVAHSAMAGLKKAYTMKPDLILLDLMLPGMDGWQTCSRFREMSDVPVIMLTALDSNNHVIQGLEMGADDYIVKPVSTDVLVARIRAVLRRTPHSRPQHDTPAVLTHDGVTIDFDKHEVWVDGNRIQLTPNEFSLLAVLVRNRGRVLPFDYLLSEVWGPQYIDDKNYLRLYIRYLRQKIEKDPSNPQLIHSEWGIGYRFG
jgi:two-component system KDP operon response regulator KdpE